ncbi:MAG: class A beta-lactamase-related serine hydrolase [Bifidobacterium sp.]|nr:class A beta-lactamase-related serine hydrolase [Bifidobacterium sp.]MCH4174339.1 class A beta-lactamase-related serine hydrolase [Bifidobacterium sp.]
MGRHIPAHRRSCQNNRRKQYLAAALVVAIVVLCGVAYWWIPDTKRSALSHATSSEMSTSDTSSNPDLARTAAPKINTQDAAKQSEQRKLDALQEQLKTQIAGYQGTWQVYVADMSSGASISVNNHQQPAASLIKLYIMLAVFQQIHDGHLTDTTQIDNLLTQMITVSSNLAANELISTLGEGNNSQGFALVNQIAQRYGFSQTSQSDLLYDSGTHDATKKVTSAQDCGKFMTSVYNNDLVSEDSSQRMLTLLLAQTRRSKIPAGLPTGTHVANKTGEIPGTENDAALVYTTSGAYTITVLTQEIDSSSQAQAEIRELSKLTWETMIG